MDIVEVNINFVKDVLYKKILYILNYNRNIKFMMKL